MMQMPGSNGLGPIQTAGYPPGGGGGYGAPPGGGFGAPPGGGFGAPPGGGGFGPPPGGGGYGAPPGGGFGPPPGGGFPLGGGMMMSGGRVNYTGSGGSVFSVWLMGLFVPTMVVALAGFGPAAGLMIVAMKNSPNHPEPALMGAAGLIYLLAFVALIGVSIVGGNKLIKHYWENVTIEGNRCAYHGTAGGLVGAMIVPMLLTSCTMGLYSPWLACRLRSWIFSQVDVSGQRLEFTGDGSGLLGPWLLGGLLIMVTAGIYFPWHHNNMLEYFWANTSISGRPFRFQKDPGGYFGVWLLNLVLRSCTGGLYLPWALSNEWDWEAKHIG
ncbi:MAG: hypothetical protein JWM10_4200 [Myxococcaceae bacterium]|nr:hypothetical protein [Myxococcaceae bacterium]